MMKIDREKMQKYIKEHLDEFESQDRHTGSGFKPYFFAYYGDFIDSGLVETTADDLEFLKDWYSPYRMGCQTANYNEAHIVPLKEGCDLPEEHDWDDIFANCDWTALAEEVANSFEVDLQRVLMSTEKLNTEVYKKAFAEQEEFKNRANILGERQRQNNKR